MKITPEMLKKYSEGNCTDEEILLIENWLSSLEDDVVLSDTAIGHSIDNIRTKLDATLFESGSQTPIVPLHKKIVRYAAAVVILFSVGFLTYYYLSNQYFNVDSNPNTVAFKTIESQRGQKRTVKLPDGSTIRLNYETQIRVPERFTESERTVFLSGHAHFDIAKDPDRPFIIYTENSRTQVLGTSFDIRTNINSEETEIIVTNGKVDFADIKDRSNKVILTVNDRAVLQKNKTIKVSEVEAQKLTAWKDNRLVFEDQTLAEVIEILEPWYNVKISVTKRSLLDERFTFSYKNPSLEMIVDRMSLMTGFDYRKEGKEIIIY